MNSEGFESKRFCECFKVPHWHLGTESEEHERLPKREMSRLIIVRVNHLIEAVQNTLET
jgi:hypothetical protein